MKQKRNEALQRAESILLHDAPVAPVYQKGEAHLTNPQVKGLQYHKIGPDTTLKHVYIDKSIDRETGKRKITKIRVRDIKYLDSEKDNFY